MNVLPLGGFLLCGLVSFCLSKKTDKQTKTKTKTTEYSFAVVSMDKQEFSPLLDEKSRKHEPASRRSPTH
jgi:hypothetical protein